MINVNILGVEVRAYLDLKRDKGFGEAKNIILEQGFDPLMWEATVIHWVVSNGNWQYGISEEDLKLMGWINDIGGFGDEVMRIPLRSTEKYELMPDSVKISE